MNTPSLQDGNGNSGFPVSATAVNGDAAPRLVLAQNGHAAIELAQLLAEDGVSLLVTRVRGGWVVGEHFWHDSDDRLLELAFSPDLAQALEAAVVRVRAQAVYDGLAEA